MDKLKMHSPNLAQDNIAKIRELFPGCVTEAQADDGSVRLAVDFDQLRQELSGSIVEGPQERYHLNWPGKREALLTANAPIAKTLRPCREESVDFDTTENLFIEGDNLDALKLLQETYLGKVKMIYIDPPYNTGKDFVYEDNFSENTDEFLKRSNQKDEEGNRLVANTESNGRFHSDWLSMIYSRLKISRNLLDDDGVVFVNIDEHEFENLLKICCEIFGEENNVGTIAWKNCTDNNPTNIAIENEFIVVFSKIKSKLENVWKSSVSDVKSVLVKKFEELTINLSTKEELEDAYHRWFKEHKSELWPLDGYKNIDFGGIYAGIRGVHNPGKDGYRYDVLHPVSNKPCKQPLMGYRFPEETMNNLLSEDKIIFGDDESKIIELKAYAQDYQEKLSSVLELDNRSGAYDVRSLFLNSKSLFENPKPIKLIQRFISLVVRNGECVIDFFAGSSATAHATMQLNAEDGGNRKFIMVQLPEPTPEKSEAHKAGYPNIAEISKERIRRAGKKILEGECHENWNKDTGFRVLKVDTSNIEDVYYTPDATDQSQLGLFADNIKADRTPEDLLFQVLLDWGVDLTLPISKQTLQNKTVFFVNHEPYDLIACFDKGINEDLIKALTQYKPLRMVFRDNGFDSDAVKINAEQIFKQMSPGTDVKAI